MAFKPNSSKITALHIMEGPRNGFSIAISPNCATQLRTSGGAIPARRRQSESKASQEATLAHLISINFSFHKRGDIVSKLLNCHLAFIAVALSAHRYETICLLFLANDK